jgi:heterotetrameric sarcosine oxidase delta subunit
MLRIPCPHCGVRDHSEFTFLGNATTARPTSDDPKDPAWQIYVYTKTNVRGMNEEVWHHVHGCRSWLVVSRDTATHEISSARLARNDKS